VLDYMLLMHRLPDEKVEATLDFGPYLAALQAAGRLRGGGAIGGGTCVRKTGTGAAPQITGHITGYIRVVATDLEDALGALPGNPVFESGGTVEIRELPGGG
jgi:hypothetical protein